MRPLTTSLFTFIHPAVHLQLNFMSNELIPLAVSRLRAFAQMLATLKFTPESNPCSYMQ